MSRPPEVVSAKVRSLLGERQRGALHKGDPLDVGGIEERGNDFRARTPRLQNNGQKATIVDREEMRRRRLAMYQEGQSFTQPLPLAVATPDQARVDRKPESKLNLRNEISEEHSKIAEWLFSLIGAGIAGAILLWNSVRS